MRYLYFKYGYLHYTKMKDTNITIKHEMEISVFE